MTYDPKCPECDSTDIHLWAGPQSMGTHQCEDCDFHFFPKIPEYIKISVLTRLHDKLVPMSIEGQSFNESFEDLIEFVMGFPLAFNKFQRARRDNVS